MATKMTKATTEEKPVVKVEKRKFEKDELIPVKSITGGELLMVGHQTGLLYKWVDFDDVQEVEYQDLQYDVRASGSYSKYPRFIILDEDFVEQNKLGELYDSLYSKDDIREILELPANQLKKVIEGLPKGAKESIKTLASTMIRNGSFDSVSKIKVIDEIFETEMLHTLTDN